MLFFVLNEEDYSFLNLQLISMQTAANRVVSSSSLCSFAYIQMRMSKRKRFVSLFSIKFMYTYI